MDAVTTNVLIFSAGPEMLYLKWFSSSKKRHLAKNLFAQKKIYISPRITLEAKSSRKGSDMKSVFSHDHVRCVLLDGAAITDNGALSAEFIRVLRG